VALARQVWIGRRQSFMGNMLTRLALADEPNVRASETSLKTNMAKTAKTAGWAQSGVRLVDHAPFDHWNTQTFIAALRHNRLDAPWVIGGAMSREFYDLHVETQLAPTLHKGDVLRRENDPRIIFWSSSYWTTLPPTAAQRPPKF